MSTQNKIKPVVSKTGFEVKVKGYQRDNICEKCLVKMEQKEVDNPLPTRPNVERIIRHSEKKIVNVCPQCGGVNCGRLITTLVPIDRVEPPQCLSLKCLWKYFKDSVRTLLLLNYHARRIAYCNSHRPSKENVHEKDKVLPRYRLGEPAPKTIWQGIHANLKLKCPVCRKYDVDPFLMEDKKKWHKPKL